MTDTLGTEQLVPKLRKQAKRQKREIEELQNRLLAAERKNAFLAAGIPDNAQGQAFAKVYNDDLDTAKIRGAYEALFGELGTEDDGLAGDKRVADSAVGGGTTGAPGTVAFEDALRAAKGDREKVLELIRNAPAGAGIKLPDIT